MSEPTFTVGQRIRLKASGRAGVVSGMWPERMLSLFLSFDDGLGGGYFAPVEVEPEEGRI